MKNIKVKIMLIILAVFVSMAQTCPIPNPLPMDCSGAGIPLPFHEDVLIRVKSPETTMGLLRTSGVQGDYLKPINVIRVSATLVDLYKEMLGADIVFIEPDYRVHTFTDDALWTKQWNFHDTKGGANIENMWEIADNLADTITIGVIDTGLDYHHEDVADCVLEGKNYVTTGLPQDDHGHGTHVAGTIAEKTGNSLGSAGITKACILPVKILDKDGGGTVSNLVQGMIWACDNGADILNMSLGGSVSCADQMVLQEAVNHCVSKGVIVVAAAGNSHSAQEHSPASCADVIAVSAVTKEAKRAEYSNCNPPVGNMWVDIAGQGGDKANPVWQSVLNNQYAGYTGTSMATPHVTALMAIALSHGITDPYQTLCDTSKPYESDTNIGCGIVDGYSMLQSLQPKGE